MSFVTGPLGRKCDGLGKIFRSLHTDSRGVEN